MSTIRQEGLLQMQPFRDPQRGNLFVTSTEKRTRDGAIIIYQPTMSPRPIAAYTETVDYNPVRTVSACLAYLWRRVKNKPYSNDPLHNRGWITALELKAIVQRTRTSLQNYLVAIEQILLADIWYDDDEKVLELFGPVVESNIDTDVYHELEELWEKKIKPALEQGK